MGSESSISSERWVVPWGTLRADGWVRGSLALFGASAVVYLLPILTSSQKALLSRAAGPFVFLCLVVGALAHGLERLNAQERRFWIDVAAGFGALLAVSGLSLWQPGVDRPLALNLAIEALYAAYYGALVLAVERQPHRSYRWRPTGLERALAWPAVIVFILCLFGYFSVIPLLAAGGAPASWTSSFALYLTLDGYLAARFLLLSRSADSIRWRTLYLVLGLAMAAIFGNDLLELVLYSGAPAMWGSALDLVFYLPFLVITWARCRHGSFREDRSTAPADERPETHFTRPSGRTMVHALAFALLHLGGYGFGFLSVDLRPERGLLVFFATLFLGSIAVIQHRVLEKKARELWDDRVEAEASLRRNEKDLRMMVERYHAGQKLRQSEEKLAKAFRVCPDSMALTSLVDGRIKEVNDRFELITGYLREDAVGKTVTELDLYADPEERQRMVRILELEGAVRNLEMRFRMRNGRIVTGLFSVEKLTIGGEPHMLSVTHDITERKRIEEKLKTQAVLLDKAQDAIAILDLEGRVTYWNRSAERLYGWSASEALGRLATELLDGEAPTQALEASKRVDERGDWIGEMRQVTKDGAEILVESWWTLVRDSDGNPKSKLVVSTDVTGRRAESLPA